MRLNPSPATWTLVFALALTTLVSPARAQEKPAPDKEPASTPAAKKDNGNFLEGIQPKVVVLMLGTNNIKSDPPDAIARADAKIVRTIREKLPNTKVLLLGVFPRAHKTDAAEIPDKVKAVNADLAKLADGQAIRYLDLSEKLAPGGKLVPDYYTDGVHLTPKGYQAWADAIESPLADMTK
jgi:lysophospholipase L1-like esterase